MPLANAVLDLLAVTGGHLVALLAPPLAVLVPLQLLAGRVERSAQRAFGRRGYLYLFGWLGVGVHEGSHAAACLLFGHRVHRVRWFDPSARDGTLGSVEHSFNRRNPWHQAGHLVIGVAPLLVGGALLAGSARGLLGLTLPTWPVQPAGLADPSWLQAAMASGPDAWWALVQESGASVRARWDATPPWRWALFAFLSVAIGGAMSLSTSDLRAVARGLVVTALLLAVANAATRPWGPWVDTLVARAAVSVAVASGLLLPAVVVNAAAAVVLGAAARLRGGLVRQ